MQAQTLSEFIWHQLDKARQDQGVPYFDLFGTRSRGSNLQLKTIEAMANQLGMTGMELFLYQLQDEISLEQAYELVEEDCGISKEAIEDLVYLDETIDYYKKKVGEHL